MTANPFADEELPYDPFETYDSREETSADRALNQREFELLVEGAGEMGDYYREEARLILYLAGRLGMRRGEITHLRKEWIDFNSNYINVPAHEPCTMGKDGGICGSCRQSAKQMAKHNDVSFSEVKDLFWKAKTPRAERSIPYSFSPNAVDAIETYFEKYDKLMVSYGGVSRRLKKASEHAPESIEDVSPHALRATAAMNHVEAGIDMWALQSFMGWAYPNTARRYILNNARRTKKLLEERHGLTER